MRNSATGTASQAPYRPKKSGRINRSRTVNTSVLQKEINAETVPFDRAVKNPEEVIFTPLNRNPTEKILKPTEASWKVRVSLVNTATIGVDRKMAANPITIEETDTNRKEMR